MPGQPGTKKFMSQYGQNLVCIRYRYDATTHQKYTTVEVIVKADPVAPRPQRIPHNKIMSLRVKYGEIEVGKAIKAAGGRWNAERKVWELKYQQVVALKVTDRIVTEEDQTASRPDRSW